jgi:putative ABC transport system permease protein
MRRDRYHELRTLLRPDRIEDDVDEELRLHLELRAAELERGGMAPDVAREEALRRFGDVSRYRTETCAIDESVTRERRRMEILDAVRRETRHSLRSLLRAPMFAGVAVLTLALGIGATTALFTLLDSIVLRPLPYPEPDRLVQLRHAVPRVQEGQEWENSVASYFHYGTESSSFEELGAALRTTFSVSGDGEAERLEGARVSASLFSVLGARAAHGRLIGEEDDRPGVDPVAVLGHEIWRTRYQADPGIVGRDININAQPVRVIGVLAPGFTLPNHATHIWLPAQLDRTAEAVNSHYVPTFARLRPGVTAQAARAELVQLADRLPALFPNAYSEAFFQRSGFTPQVHPLRSIVLGKAGSGRMGIDGVLWMLLGAVSLVLLIACANVANLMLARAEVRRRELTVRSALGAERVHMAVHYLTESLLLASAAAVLGVFLAWGGVQLLLATAPATLPRLADVGLSLNAIMFAAGVSALTGVVFGVVPVLRHRSDFAELRESGRGATASRRRQLARGALVVSQVAMALVLLAAGGLMLKTFLNLRSVDAGLNPDGVLTFSVTLPALRYPEEVSVAQFHRELTQRIGALPGVAGTSAVSSLPLGGGAGCAHTVGEGSATSGADAACVPVSLALPGYFETMGIAVAGRELTWSDFERRADVAVISRALSQRLWPGEDPLGRRLISFQDGPPWFTIVGVADDVLADGLDQPAAQTVYYPTRRPDAEGYWGPHGPRTLTFVVKSSTSDPVLLTRAVRSVVRGMDPEVPLADVRTMNDVIMNSDRMARTTFTMMLLGIAAVVALFLSAVGLYGVISYLVGRRRAEIGVRMALGARVSEVARLVVIQSVRLTLLGIVAGVIAALFVTRALTALVWGVQPTDPVTLLLVSALLLVVAVAASALPARRAARTPPSDALRSD